MVGAIRQQAGKQAIHTGHSYAACNRDITLLQHYQYRLGFYHMKIISTSALRYGKLNAIFMITRATI